MSHGPSFVETSIASMSAPRLLKLLEEHLQLTFLCNGCFSDDVFELSDN